MGKPTTIVRFTKKYPPFNVGEEACYDAAGAKTLVDGGVAVLVGAAPPPPGELAEPVHKGGGVYIVGDQNIKGKKNAWALYEKLKSGT